MKLGAFEPQAPRLHFPGETDCTHSHFRPLNSWTEQQNRKKEKQKVANVAQGREREEKCHNWLRGERVTMNGPFKVQCVT